MHLYLARLARDTDATLGKLYACTKVYGFHPYEQGRLTVESHMVSDHRDRSCEVYQRALARCLPTHSSFTTEDNKVCFAVRLSAGDPIIGVRFHDGDIWIGGPPEWVSAY